MALIAHGKIRIELIALTGLFILGIVGPSEPDVIFSGFGNPALITITSVFIISQGIIHSEALRGLGQLIEQKIANIRGQVIGVSLVSSFLSAFMNNVGAVGLLLPTVVRMSDRKQIDRGVFGLPLAFASVVGGSLTLIGSAPNIITASYMYSATGDSFRMFDFTYHGFAMVVTGLILWLILSFFGYAGINHQVKNSKEQDTEHSKETPKHFSPLSTPTKKLTIFIVLVAVLTVSTGILHPGLGFGAAGLLLIFSGVLTPQDAYQSIDLKIIFFLGSMLGIGEILEDTSSIELLSNTLIDNLPEFSPAVLILLLILISSALSNGINNSASAVFMAPIAVVFAEQTDLETAASLMAVAAGSNLTLLLPTHQAVLMVQSKAPFSPRTFAKIGILLTIVLSLVAAFVINLVWQ